MNFAYKVDSTVTGLNRSASEPGELTGTCTPQDLTEGMDPEKYLAPGGSLVPKSQEDLDALEYDRALAEALHGLWIYHDDLIEARQLSPTPKSEASKFKALRKETKGTADAGDLKVLDDNDLVDSWLDEIEHDAEAEGEAYLEDPVRTLEELQIFDPATDVTWTAFPVL